MATQVTRINPLDLQGNIAIGVALPFGRIDTSLPDPAISGSYITGPGVFRSTYSTQEQIKSNLINLLLTNKGERVFNPEFGADLKKIIFEGVTEETSELIRELISSNVNIFMPEIAINNVDVVLNPDYNSINITVSYRIKLSNTPDQVTVEFI